ncbi:MAG: tetrahydrofolate dehydrogenase/cyclohydrolase catalytic domain-containing protein [Candidatus Gastranaerophilales bacterium]|nr:tetrahydrofolate dehydrogenase/cyclohydrolase catalytic domain-containing protein [Candidatus Gastranaerophilales bacterium]
MTTILDGKKLSAKMTDELTQKVAMLDEKPHLAVILVGENPASELYVGLKKKTAEKIGIKSTVIKYPQNTDEKTVLDKINELNNDKNVHAILVQLPLPGQISEKKVIQAISPQKDADGITPENIGKISIGVEPYAYPCTPKGILSLLDEYNINIEGKHAVVIGRSNIVGKPLAQMLLNRNATVTICHSHTKNLTDIIKSADVLISAVGKNKLIKKEMIKSNSVIIDVGTSKVGNRVVGDVDFDNLFELVSYITPSPGGVGPMTIASLMENTYNLFKLSRNG